jgi:DNA invertase Pin-like site-specific DNA recombinase
MLTVVGMMAEMELGFIKARHRDGMERAKSRGDVYKGGTPMIDRSACAISSTKELERAKSHGSGL